MVELKVVNDFPPNFDQLAEVFNLSRSTNVIITYGDTVYNPYNCHISEATLAHEMIHAKQQKKLGKDKYVARYISDIEFRIKSEIEAYGAELVFIQGKDGKKVALETVRKLAQNLSSSVYGNVILEEDAYKQLIKFIK